MHYCCHCFAEIKDTAGRFCPECGQEHSEHYGQSYELPAGTYLNNGRYFVGESLGSGGFGITYLGFDVNLKKKVVIKETFYIGYFKRNVYDKKAANPLWVEYDDNISLEYIMNKTQKECESLSEGESLNNIMRVYDLFSENNTAYIITEYINGETLYDRITKTGGIDWNTLYSKIKPLMRSLSILHKKGILHRDIKPQNIMIKHAYNLEEEYILIDFGLARSANVRTLSSMGIAFSPGYSPFEQRTFTQPDGTYTDVYAMAATMYHALSGEAPNTLSVGEIEENFPKLADLEKNNSIPKHVVAALRYSLNPNFKERCQNFDEFIGLLDNTQDVPRKTNAQNSQGAYSQYSSSTVFAQPMTGSLSHNPAVSYNPAANNSSVSYNSAANNPSVSYNPAVNNSSVSYNPAANTPYSSYNPVANQGQGTYNPIQNNPQNETLYKSNPASTGSETVFATQRGSQKPITYQDIIQPNAKSRTPLYIGIASFCVGIIAVIAAAAAMKLSDKDVDNVGDTGAAASISVTSREESSNTVSEEAVSSSAEIIDAASEEETSSVIPEDDPLNGEGANGTISLKVWAPDNAVSVISSQCDAFCEEMSPYANIKINVAAQGEADAANQVLVDAEASADVFGFACDNVNRLANADALLEITGEDKEFVNESNIASSVESASIDDKLYAFPETGDNSYILFYDKNVVSDEQAKTLEGTLKACKAANKKFVMEAGNGYYSSLFMFTGGLTIDGLEDDGVTQKFHDYDEADLVNTMLAFQKLFAGEYKDIFLNGDSSKVVDGFKSGTVGAGIDGSWNFASAKEALGDKAGFAKLPTIKVNNTDTQIVNFFGYKLLGVNSSTKYPATATALAKYLSGEECQLERAEQLNWGPSNKAAAESDVVRNDPALAAILEQANYSVPLASVSDTFWAPTGTFGNKIVDPDTTLTESSAKTLIKETISNIRDE